MTHTTDSLIGILMTSLPTGVTMSVYFTDECVVNSFGITNPFQLIVKTKDFLCPANKQIYS